MEEKTETKKRNVYLVWDYDMNLGYHSWCVKDNKTYAVIRTGFRQLQPALAFCDRCDFEVVEVIDYGTRR